jgi:hypothetical protein
MTQLGRRIRWLLGIRRILTALKLRQKQLHTGGERHAKQLGT